MAKMRVSLEYQQIDFVVFVVLVCFTFDKQIKKQTQRFDLPSRGAGTGCGGTCL